MRQKSLRNVYQRHTHVLKAIRFLASLAIEVNVLIRYGMMSAAMAQLIFQRTASVLYHMNDIFFFKITLKSAE